MHYNYAIMCVVHDVHEMLKMRTCRITFSSHYRFWAPLSDLWRYRSPLAKLTFPLVPVGSSLEMFVGIQTVCLQGFFLAS